MRPTIAIAALALAVSAALTAAARAADVVDLQVRGNEKVQGTLRPADERESFLLEAPMGAAISASVKAVGTGGPLPQLDIVDEAFTVLATGTAKGKGAKLPPFTAATSQVHRVRVFGDGALDGDYQLKLKMTPRKSWPGASPAPLDAASETEFEFHAPSNAVCAIALTAAVGSPMTPRIVRVDGPGGFTLPVSSSGATNYRHSASGLPLAGFGRYTVRIRNDGASAGDWNVKVSLSFPKARKTTVDIRDTSLTGAFGGAQQVFGRVVDAFGAPVDPGITGGPLDGASISVPPDALADPAVIAITTANTFFVDDDAHPAGVAVAFSPSGTTFAQDVTVTIPFDAQSFDDPANEMTIYIEDGATGSLAPAAKPYVFDLAAGTVSFQTSHFSRFEGTSPRDRPCRGEYVQLELGGAPQSGFGGEVRAGLHGVNFLRTAPGGKTPVRDGNAYSMDIDRRVVRFVPGAAGSIAWAPLQFTDGGTVVLTDDETIDVAAFALSPFTYLRGRNEDALLISGSGSGGSGVSALLRRTKGRPTRFNLAGGWTAFAYEFRAVQSKDGSVALVQGGRTARVDLGLDGSARAKQSTAVAAFLGADGAWSFRRTDLPLAPGTFTLGVDATDHSYVDLDLRLGGDLTPSVTRLYPVLRGQAMVGIDGAPEGSPNAPTAAYVRAVVLVRQAQDASPKLLAGRSIQSSFGFAPVTGPTLGQLLAWRFEDVTVRRDGVKALSATGGSTVAAHAAASGSPTVTSSPIAVDGTYKVLGDGTYTATGYGEVGAVAGDSGFYVTARFADALFALGFGTVARPAPPAGPK